MMFKQHPKLKLSEQYFRSQRDVIAFKIADLNTQFSGLGLTILTAEKPANRNCSGYYDKPSIEGIKAGKMKCLKGLWST
ncbi:hypothetical protein EJ377_05045 [Chryseobacterium arthrosphaerae]|uniref:Uncharacterized protein n=1 Tax=Chryseobacterium arthrosphaerae TaxID=651561 RepID=A0A3S0N5M7_9FLAO|nr:hypothetical protein EJ377_05045 [Chryseobacterium arthrosphaerae]